MPVAATWLLADAFAPKFVWRTSRALVRDTINGKPKDSQPLRRHDGDPFQQLGFRQHAETDGGDLSGEGLDEVDGRDLAHLQRGGDAVVAARIREAGHRATVHADRHHLDAVARLKRFQRRREGVAVGAVAAEEEEQHMVAAQCPDGLGALRHLLLLEHLQRLGVDRPALQGRIEFGCRPGHPLRDIGEGRGPRDHPGFQLHVAADVGLGRPHDGDVAGFFERPLQPLEFDDLGWLDERRLHCRGSGFGRRDRAVMRVRFRVFVEVPAPPGVGPVGRGRGLRAGRWRAQDGQHQRADQQGVFHDGRLMTATLAAGRRGSS